MRCSPLEVFLAMRLISRLLPVIATALAAAPTRPVASQVVRGVVASNRVPSGIAGAVVLLLDTTGVVRARALTAAGGEFRIASPAREPFRLRTLRIGFRPTTTEAFVITRDTSIVLRVLVVAIE